VLIEPLGAGNARNVGISRGDAEWVLLLDDDERFAPDMLHRLWARLHDSGAGAITARLDMVTPDELGSAGELPAALRSRPAGPAISMWPGFGSGCALLRRSLLAEAGGFDRRLDGGFGEDTELGVRLRRAGATVVLATDPPVAHLKAPVGGMRTPFPHPWRSDPVRPRPSPTVLLARRSFETPAMASGYRIHWWLDGIRREGLSFRPHRRWRQWRSAQRWSDHLARGASITSEPSVVSSSVPPAVGPADPAARTP
jgi:glycosyltransferase involved in cell wall biosynthesis